MADSEDSFVGSLQTAELGEVKLFDMRTPAHSVTRCASDINPEAAPHCKLSLQLEGTSTLTQNGRTATLSPGDLALYVTQVPYELHYPCSQRTLVVYFPQRMLHFSPAQISSWTARPISREEGLGSVAIPLFEQLAAHIDILNGTHAESLVHSALNMLIAVFSSEITVESSSLLFRQAQRYIEENLADPGLSPTSISRALFVSVRHLHAQFAREGLSVATYIRSSRLSRIRDELVSHAHSDETIQAISARYGLADASHFSRVFKAEFGESPKAYQARWLGPRT